MDMQNVVATYKPETVSYISFRAVLLKVGEIDPEWRFYASWGRFCDLPDFGGRFLLVRIY